MSLLNLAARVCRAFHDNATSETRTVQKVKDGQSRDVVTALDLKLHELSATYTQHLFPGCRLLSEEGEFVGFNDTQLMMGQWLIVDPLDGSSNYALGMPNFGYMAAHLRDGYLDGVAVVLPEENQYIVMEDGETVYAQPLPVTENDGGTVYYAYPPRQSLSAQQARNELQTLIDNQSAGMYRYGSACVGLYHLLCGRHMAFLGHGIRIWDAVAFMPLLVNQGFDVMYCIDGLSITVLASKKTEFLSKAAQILLHQQNLSLCEYNPLQAIRIKA